MKRNRIVVGILWILSLVGISFFGGAISYGFFVLMTMIPITSVLYLGYVYYFFHMYQKIDSKWLVACETSPFYFTLVNDYHFLFSGIRVQFYSDFSEVSGLSEDTEYEFWPKTGFTKETNICCRYRGEYLVGINKVIVQDYFRLFCFKYRNKEPLKVVVRPRLIKLENFKNEYVSAAFKDSAANASEPDVLVRNYVPGDDIRQIHWNLSAKSNELMVRKRIGQEQRGIGIILSTKRVSDKINEYLPAENKMLEIALAITMHFSEKNIPVFHFNRNANIEMKSVAGIEQFDEYYDYISSLIYDENYDDNLLFAEVASNQNLLNCRTVFIIVSDYSDGLLSIVSGLGLHNVNTVIFSVNEKKWDNEENVNGHQVSLVHVSPEDNLTEVM